MTLEQQCGLLWPRARGPARGRAASGQACQVSGEASVPPAGGVYLADVLLCLHIGFVLVSWDGRRAVVTDGPTSLACYARHGYLKWDLPAGWLGVGARSGAGPACRSCRK